MKKIQQVNEYGEFMVGDVVERAGIAGKIRGTVTSIAVHDNPFRAEEAFLRLDGEDYGQLSASFRLVSRSPQDKVSLEGFTSEQLSAELDRREIVSRHEGLTNIPEGWQLIASDKIVAGIHEVLDPDGAKVPWKAPDALKTIIQGREVLLVARVREDAGQ